MNLYELSAKVRPIRPLLLLSAGIVNPSTSFLVSGHEFKSCSLTGWVGYHLISGCILYANSTVQFSEASGLSQVFKDQDLSQPSNPDTRSLAGNDDS
jgi:hypothetical protein